jgi:hypothetical protein
LNIYLDIDGTILLDERHAARGADEFLQAVLAKYPNNTYWLTTHCWQGENRALDVLRRALQPGTMKLLEGVKPTDWNIWKTDAIDFNQPFLWFDDDRSPEEAEILNKHGVVDSHVQMDLYADPEQLITLRKQYFE